MSRAAPSSISWLLHQAALRAVIPLAVVVFGPVWYYRAGETGVIPFPGIQAARALMWLTALFVIGAHVLRFGLGRLIGVLAPFLPFLAWGAVGVLWSVDPVTSVRGLIFWGLGGGAAAAAALELSLATMARWTCATMVCAVVLSFAMAVLAPNDAFTLYDGVPTLRGLFSHKNLFGWFCALGLVWAWTLRGHLGGRFAVVSCLIFVAGLLVSNSKTSLAAAVIVLVYMALVAVLPRLFGDGARAFLMTLFILFAMAAVLTLIVPALLQLMGRDTNLTGRGDVWRHYLGYILQRPLTGFGTGLFSFDTDLNARIGGTIPGAEEQGLHSPHNTYIGILGETGVIGLGFFVLCHLYIMLVAPFRRLDLWTRLAAAISLGILSAAVSEMRDASALGFATVLILLCRAAAVRSGTCAAMAPRAPAASEPPTLGLAAREGFR